MSNPSDLTSDFATLSNLNVDLKNKSEELKQAIYRATQQLNVKKALVLEYQQEIVTTRHDFAKQIKEIQLKILRVEGEIKNQKIVQSQEIEAVESQLKQKSESVNALKREIDIAKRNKLMVERNASPGINADELSAKIKALKASYISSQQELQLFRDQHAEALEGLQVNQQLLEELTESTEVKRVELQEKEAEISALSEELCAANEQLKAYSSIPLSENSKGNSLFSQVHDRCMQLEKNVEQMKLKYKHVEQELKAQEKAILALHKENQRLRRSWESDLQQKQSTLKFAGESSTDEMTLMENRMEELQLQWAEAAGTIKAHFSQVILQDKRSEIFELGKTLSVLSKKVCALAVDLVDANNEMRLLNFKALQLEQQTEEARQQKLLTAESNKCRRYTMFEVRPQV